MRNLITPAILVLMILPGCSRGSQFVGIWSGQAKPARNETGFAGIAADMLATMMKGTSTLSLKADGTGYLRIAGLPEQSILEG